ncbi:hypothetical protein VNO80_21197 [Phaseolus coccineus]|uniref:Uncharacterized protein n=1 Tax=Phaseolus coccineus TaxID=3886 RepID=A0AAN9M5Q1_PHACN
MQGARNYRSVTIRRLEDAAISYRGPERVQLLRRWVVSLQEIQKLSEAEASLTEEAVAVFCFPTAMSSPVLDDNKILGLSASVFFSLLDYRRKFTLFFTMILMLS